MLEMLRQTFDLSGEALLWVKALHLISVISWMAGLLYLPRLFVYHSQVEPGSDLSQTFKIMERRLLHAIMHPALVASLITGLLLLINLPDLILGWLHAKLGCIALLIACHVALARWRNDFARDANHHSERFYRIFNEAPTVLMIIIVIMAIVEPF